MTAPVDRIPVPTSPAELEEMMGNPARMQAVFADPGAFRVFITNYARTVYDRDQSIVTQIREEVERVTAQFLRTDPDVAARIRRPDLRPGGPAAGGPRAEAYNPEAAGAALDALFESPRDYLRTIWHRNMSPDAVGLRNRILNEFSSQTPESGGFLVPESLRSTLLQVALEKSIVRPRAMVVPMETARVPFPVIDDTSHASSVYGGMIGYWTEEGGALIESAARFGRATLDAKKLTGYSEAPNELFSDSIISFEAFLSQKWPEAIAFFEDVAFFNGTGVGQPLGFLRAQAAVSVAAEAGQAADTIVWENIARLFSRMLPTSLGSAVWIANINTFVELATMALSVGTGGSAIWLNNGAVGPPMTILGRPVIFTEKASTLGDAGDLNFVDLSYYLVGDRQAMTMETSAHYRFANDQTAVRIIERVDGMPWIQSAITPVNGSLTLSPFIKIAAR